MMLSIARILIVIGVVFLVVGALIYLASRLNIPLGNLPGDIRIKTSNMTCVFALGTSILLSILLTVVLNIVVRLLNK